MIEQTHGVTLVLTLDFIFIGITHQFKRRHANIRERKDGLGVLCEGGESYVACHGAIGNDVVHLGGGRVG
jgi:hypothetical protein